MTATPEPRVWRGRRALVTGGASFIGAHLTRALAGLGAAVRVVDDLSSGRLENLGALVGAGGVEFHRGDLRSLDCARQAVAGIDTVFHLAANHGGRGYIATHEADCSTNLALDSIVFLAAREANVEKLVFASSACVYPISLQHGDAAPLAEDAVAAPYEPDGSYGWAKLSAELALASYHRETGLRSVACRYFTVYGPLCGESHALLAMMARARMRQDPFELWGDGQQVRNWTYVDDVVRGTLLAAERIDDGSAINLGASRGLTVLDAARAICAELDHHPRFVFRGGMPTGPRHRVADGTRAEARLGFRPEIAFDEGIARTAAWYRGARSPEDARAIVDGRLLERT